MSQSEEVPPFCSYCGKPEQRKVECHLIAEVSTTGAWILFSVCVCAHVCVCACTRVRVWYVCVCVFVCKSFSVSIHVYMCLCIYTYTCIHACVIGWVCVNVAGWMCMHLCVCGCLSVSFFLSLSLWLSKCPSVSLCASLFCVWHWSDEGGKRREEGRGCKCWSWMVKVHWPAQLRPFLIGNKHERSHEHSKHRCFLIDLASTSWCLDFARTVFTAVFGSKSRHPKRSGIWQDGGTQIQARQGKHAENGSGSI